MRPGALGHPLSRECGQFHSCETCQGFSGDLDTYLCGHACHWCPRGEHRRGTCDCAVEAS